jgi:hypothetical protein
MEELSCGTKNPIGNQNEKKRINSFAQMIKIHYTQNIQEKPIKILSKNLNLNRKPK